MHNNAHKIEELTSLEVDQIGAGVLQAVAAAVAIVSGLIYIGGELHDALCKDHK